MSIYDHAIIYVTFGTVHILRMWTVRLVHGNYEMQNYAVTVKWPFCIAGIFRTAFGGFEQQ